MDRIQELLSGNSARLIFSIAVFLVGVGLIIVLYRYVVKKLTLRVGRTESHLDDFVVEVLRLPFLCLLVWIAVRIFSQTMFYDTHLIDTINHALQILLIITIGWILMKLNKIMFYYLAKKVEEDNTDRYEVRSSKTKFSIFERIINGLLLIIVIAICLMTFDQIRSVGVGLLSSAGVAGVIVGFAAQKSLGSVMAGIQIAITQPIKLNDLVVIDGESGRIEEINMTYVVVNLWDKRRLVIPINYFLEQKFQNWTRHSSDILGQVFFYVDYRIPVEDLRNELLKIVQGNPDWDKNVCNLDVNSFRETCIELRALVSSEDAGKNSSLQFFIREKMLNYIQTKYPEYLTMTRINIVGEDKPQEK